MTSRLFGKFAVFFLFPRYLVVTKQFICPKCQVKKYVNNPEKNNGL